ncbi:MAG: hypothetical protein ACI9LG_000551 [Moritella dasanensis]|jgi:hypothetical protein
MKLKQIKHNVKKIKRGRKSNESSLSYLLT